ncbi:MAG: hypothetical protein NZ866_00900 [Patescibacteria group bacterium]|nr:hypothetical protein [Patescibacteria group bacterium]
MKKLFIFFIIFLNFIFFNLTFAVGVGGGGYIPSDNQRKQRINTDEGREEKRQINEFKIEKKNVAPLQRENRENIILDKEKRGGEIKLEKKEKKIDEGQYKNKICSNLRDLKERILCRLSKDKRELEEEPFLPEECRTLSGVKKVECLKLYKSFNKCFHQEKNLDSCALKNIGLRGNNVKEWVKECQDKKGKGKLLDQCKENLRNKLLNYLKFYLYYLSYRLEEIRSTNQDELTEIAEFISFIETTKQKLNNAKNEEIGNIIDEVEQRWQQTILKLNLPQNFNKKSNLVDLKSKYETTINTVNNLR